MQPLVVRHLRAQSSGLELGVTVDMGMPATSTPGQHWKRFWYLTETPSKREGWREGYGKVHGQGQQTAKGTDRKAWASLLM